MSALTTTYLITGASRGLGLETARQLLAQSEHNRVIAAARSPEKAESLQKLIQANLGRIEAVSIDVADPASITAGIAEIGKLDIAKSGIDVLVNNAGVCQSWKYALEIDVKEIQNSMQINVYGTIDITPALLPLLRAGRGKKIITTSSEKGSITNGTRLIDAAAYSMTKAAVNMYFVKLAEELRDEGFTIILHCPGYVKTDMNGGLEGGAVLLPEESVSATLKNVYTRGFKDTGRFFNNEGTILPW